jgi:ATP-dependent DNA helicase RecG
VASVKQNPVKEEGLGRLSRLGFSRISECLLVVPKEYRDCTHEINVVTRGMIGKAGYFGLIVKSVTSFDKQNIKTRNWSDIVRVAVELEDYQRRRVQVSIFGAVYPWLKKTTDEKVYIYGELVTWNGYLQIEKAMLVDDEEHGRIVPIYKGKVGQVSADLVKEGVSKALPLVEESACHLLAALGMREGEFSKTTGVAKAEDFLQSIHCPENIEQGKKAIEVAKKLSALAIVRRAEANQVRKAIAKSSIAVTRSAVGVLVGRLPYPLTADQWGAIQEIVNDLRAPYPMNRLLSGDVGTGKTLTFMIPAVAAYLAGASVGIIVPSQLLVAQQAREFREFFPEVKICEVTAGGKIEEGIAIGTTALLRASSKKKHSFDFIIADEQHKFSVSQKAALLKDHTNFLEATATVIPRTLAIVNYGGMDLSVLRECPVKKVITSYVVEGHEQERMFEFVDRVFNSSTQVAIIMPLVEEQGEEVVDGRLQSVEGALQEWSVRFPTRRIGVLTGRMTAEEKAVVIAKMHSKEIDLLISTVVIENGVTLPSLRAVIVIHPERFGASQLHQLRGRVARKGGKGYFMMFCPSSIEETAKERLNLLLQYTDGFDIAEADMSLRGFGDIESDGESQTGGTKLLFWGVRIHRKDIEEAAAKSSLT